MTPNSKVTDGAIGGGIGTIVIWVLGEYGGVTLPPEVAAAGVVVLSTLIAYMLPERRAK